MAKYGKITDYKKAYVSLLRQEGELSLHQIATLRKISKSSVERIFKFGMERKLPEKRSDRPAILNR